MKYDSETLGNHVEFAPTTKPSQRRRGVPSAIALIGKTETAPATEDPKTLTRTGSNSKGLRGLTKRKLSGVKV